MFLLRNRSFATQLRWALALVAALTTLGSAGLILLGQRAARQASLVYRERLLPIQLLVEVSEAYAVDITVAMRAVRGGRMPPQAGIEILRRAEAQAQRAWSRYAALKPDTPAVREAAASLARLRQLGRQLEALMPVGVSRELGHFGDVDWLPEVARLTSQIQNLREAEDRQAQATIAELESQSRRTLWSGLGLMAVVLALTLLFGRLFSSHVKKGLARLLAQLRRVAQGDLEPVPVSDGNGELSQAQRELNRTAGRLRELLDQLRAEEARYRLLAERLPDVVFQSRIAPDGRRSWPFVSPQFAAFYGAPLEVLEEDPDYALKKIHPGDVDSYLRALEEASGCLRPMTWEGRSLTERPGELKWIRVRRSPTLEADGSILWDGVFEDITQLKQSEEALRLSEARAREASQAKSAFLASMSHELRTPLSAILGYTRLMAREPGRSEADRVQLEYVLKAGEHLLGLINDVLSLAKIEAGRMELKAQAFSPAGLIGELEALFRLNAQSKGLQFEVQAQELPEFVEGDLAKLRQVLVNLLGNAVKFTETGAVRLRASWTRGQAAFLVEDTGPGIAAEDQERIFSPFQQTAVGQAAAGSGLGLHISQSLVHLLGGRLELDSAPGQGARFRFELPLPETEPPPLRARSGRAQRLATTSPGPVILVVDDRPENRDMLDRLLRLVGFRCRLACHGAEAVETWRHERPDLILMDLRMPVLDGFGALARIRAEEAAESPARTPILAISASVYDIQAEDLERLGFDGFLLKPIEEEDLFRHLERLLGVRFEREEPAAPAPPAAPLEGLAGQDPDWRRRMHDLVACGDLEAAGQLVEALPDRHLAAAVTSALQAYQMEPLLRHLR